MNTTTERDAMADGRQSRKMRGTIYYELYNKGGGRQGFRFVGAFYADGRRLRFRSTSYDNVAAWLRHMNEEHGEQSPTDGKDDFKNHELNELR